MSSVTQLWITVQKASRCRAHPRRRKLIEGKRGTLHGWMLQKRNKHVGKPNVTERANLWIPGYSEGDQLNTGVFGLKNPWLIFLCGRWCCVNDKASLSALWEPHNMLPAASVLSSQKHSEQIRKLESLTLGTDLTGIWTWPEKDSCWNRLSRCVVSG